VFKQLADRVSLLVFKS